MIKVYLALMVVGILGAAAWGAKYYYDSTQARISQLVANNATLEEATKQQQETINVMIEDRERFEKINKELQGKLQTAERYGDQLRNTLRKHNLTHLANKKPGMIEKRMQNATDRLWGCLYDITDPDGMFANAGTESPYCNKNSKNRGADSSAPEGSSAK